MKAEYLKPLFRLINIFNDLSNKKEEAIKRYGLNELKTVVDKTISLFYKNARYCTR